MAKVQLTGLDNYREAFGELAYRSEGLCKQMAYEGARIVADAVRNECPVEEGDLRDSIGLSKMENDGGFIHTKLGFAGYDRKGNPNIVKARVIESGSSGHKKNPFVRRATNRVKQTAKDAMADRFVKSVENEMK